MYKGSGTEFCRVRSHCGLSWNEVADKLSKQAAIKNMSEMSYTNYYYRLMRLFQYLRKMCKTKLKKEMKKKNEKKKKKRERRE